MILKQKEVVRLFDKFSLVVPPKLKWHQDGIPGQRILFISDRKETFSVSFEEGMQIRDMLPPDQQETKSSVSFQYCKDNKYIHLRRSGEKNDKVAFFHIELEDMKALAEEGVKIFTCGTCLDFYGMKEKLAVGEVTNMYDIVENMERAKKIIRP